MSIAFSFACETVLIEYRLEEFMYCFVISFVVLLLIKNILVIPIISLMGMFTYKSFM